MQSTLEGNGTPSDIGPTFDTVILNLSLIGVTDDASGVPTFSFSGGENLLGTFASPLDPLLAPLADNGGPTFTHALLPGSPAIDAGNSTEAFDQRGLARVIDQPFVGNSPAGNGSDIGAVEFENAVLILSLIHI